MSPTNQRSVMTPQTPDELLELIAQNLPVLWQIQRCAGNRALRSILNAAERLAQQRAINGAQRSGQRT